VSHAVNQALMHARLRWLGAAVLAVGALLLIASLVAAIAERGPWSNLVWATMTSALGLAAFGVHSDTALAILRENRGISGLPERLEREVDQEFIFHRLELSELQATPRTAVFVSVAAVVVAIWAIAATVR
jgi:hypothetical protein